MDLLIVRHAIALDRTQHPHDDSRRPLTPDGIRRARKAAAGLKRFMPSPDRVLASPLVRARQTARILTEVARWPEATDCDELRPGEPPAALLTRLRQHRDNAVAVVGHQPGLGLLLAACLLGEGGKLPVELKKSAVACVSFNGAPRPGTGVLKWLATPRMLRALRH